MKDAVELQMQPTTLWIKKGTKDLLDEFGERKDTYDDIIKKLVTLARQYREVATENRLTISDEKKRASVSVFGDSKIEYVYAVPPSQIPMEFQFRIAYTKVIYKGGERKLTEKYADAKTMAKEYLNILADIIRAHVDPLFRIQEKHVLDLGWWKRKLHNLGLDRAYEHDVEFELIKLGIHP